MVILLNYSQMVVIDTSKLSLDWLK